MFLAKILMFSSAVGEGKGASGWPHLQQRPFRLFTRLAFSFPREPPPPVFCADPHACLALPTYPPTPHHSSNMNPRRAVLHAHAHGRGGREYCLLSPGAGDGLRIRYQARAGRSCANGQCLKECLPSVSFRYRRTARGCHVLLMLI